MNFEHHISDILSVDIPTLVTMTMIIAVEIVGVTALIQDLDMKHNPWTTRRTAIWTLIIGIPCSIMNTTLVPEIATSIFDLFFLGISVVQFSRTIIAKGIPQMANAFFDKTIQMVKVKTVAEVEAKAVVESEPDNQSGDS
jgi:hypothetical protein